jgi:hypothetical protein
VHSHGNTEFESMIDFLYNLFWLPMFSIEFIINVGLWVTFGYLAYEGYNKYISKQ